MTGEKKSSDFSNRLKRPLKSTSRLSKSPAPSTPSAPPKAAIASTKPKKEDLHRRKNPFNEMLRPRSGKDAIQGSSSTADEQEQELEQVEEQDTGSSSGNMTNTPDVTATDRVIDLERALAIARAEQNALREELDKVKSLGQAYRDTIEDYRRQLAGTYQSSQPTSPRSHHASQDQVLDHERSPRRPVSSRRQQELFEQNDSLRSQLAELQDQVLHQDSLYRPQEHNVPSRTSLEWQDLTARLHNSEKESQERLQHLLDLKHSISALTRMENQVTDSDLTERIDQLYHRIREWVISNFRRTKLDLNNVSVETLKTLESIYPQYRKINSSDRLALYQALTSSAITRLFHEPICLGLPESGPLAPIRQLAAYLHDAGSDYREWRMATARALYKSEARHALQEGRQTLLHRTANDIQHQLFSLTSTNLTAQAQAALMAILTAAADLQHMLSLQKAQYTVHFFRTHDSGAYFDDDRMESINDVDDMDEDGDVFVDKQFAFCVFPCLEKFGDEFGDKPEVSNVLLKARVCCGVG